MRPDDNLQQDHPQLGVPTSGPGLSKDEATLRARRSWTPKGPGHWTRGIGGALGKGYAKGIQIHLLGGIEDTCPLAEHSSRRDYKTAYPKKNSSLTRMGNNLSNRCPHIMGC
ncbi:hypothetical protein Nepgr_030889 [Nepenthes gracilis]|uniref:Uncharacterized protein n=1 Tax=Nepenthes gracilis TaxID=150966 RepID=A0AAD3THF8_NEPGR|nr:hypothetical protein Nepgr_030889 [Nepenthes gracilis]